MHCRHNNTRLARRQARDRRRGGQIIDLTAPSTVDLSMMELAVAEADFSLSEGGIPIGAVLAIGDEVLGVGHDRRAQLGSTIRHSENDAIEHAGRLSASTYRHATLYTTLSPCHMCVGVMLYCGIGRVVIGENETFFGAADLLRANGVELLNLSLPQCVDMMVDFASAYPQLWNENVREPG